MAGKLNYSLAPMHWDATGHYPFWRFPDTVVGGVDVRPLSAQGIAGGSPRGFAFVASVQPVTSADLATANHFSEERVTARMRSAWRSSMGFAADGDNLVDLLWDQLTAGADPSGEEAPKPLVPTTAGILELHLGGHGTSPVKSERFIWGKHPHTNRLRDLLRRDFESLWEETNGHDHCRRVLDYTCGRYRVDDWTEFVPSRLHAHVAGRLPHATTITENWTRADGDTIGNLLTWTETSGDWDTLSNQAILFTTGGTAVKSARAESGLSGTDHYSQVLVAFLGASGTCIGGAAARFNSGALTFYHAHEFQTNGASDTARSQKQVTGTDTTIGTNTTGITWAGTDVIKIECNGSSIKRYRNGSLQDTATDTAITTNTRCGIVGFSSGVANVVKLDDFEAADLTLSPITGDAAITLGDLTLAATGTVGSGPGTGSASITLEPLTVAATGTLAITGTASITLGALTLTALGTGPDSRNFQLTKVGALISGQPGYYPRRINLQAYKLVDTSWPYDWMITASQDHSTGGVYAYFANGNPNTPANWVTYNAAKALGVFDYLGTIPSANPIFSYTAQGNDSETPRLLWDRLSGTFFLTFHNTSVPAGTGVGSAGQNTMLATGTSPIQFSIYQGAVAPGSAVLLPYTTNDPGDGHTGYFTPDRCPEGMPGLSNRWIGYGLYGGTDYFHYQQCGTDDMHSWTKLSVLDRTAGRWAAGLPSGTSILSFNESLANAVRLNRAGKPVALMSATLPASGGVVRATDIVEVYLDSTGRAPTRLPRVVLARGAAGSVDEGEVAQVDVGEYNGQLSGIYQGANAAGTNTICGFTGTFDPDAAEPAAPTLSDSYETEYDIDLTNSGTSLPAWLVFAGDVGTSCAVSSSGATLTIGAGKWGELKLSPDLIPDDYDFIEVFAKVDLAGSPFFAQVGDALGTTGNSFNVGSATSLSWAPRAAVYAAGVESSGNTLTAYRFTPQTNLHEFGVRWWPQDLQIATLGAGACELDVWTYASPPAITGSYAPKISFKDAGVVVKRVRIRVRSSGYSPTVTPNVLLRAGSSFSGGAK